MTVENDSTKTAFKVLFALGALHCCNDLLQSVITATYPLFKADLNLTFTQIGLITLTYQLAASIFQPVMGLFFDRRPSPWALPAGMASTICGLILLSLAQSIGAILVAVAMVGLGSSVLHPEASRITSLASGGKRGLAQGMFQVGGNFGGSLGPLLVAVIVAPHTRGHIAWFLVFAMLAYAVMAPIFRWYSSYLKQMKAKHNTFTPHVKHPLPASTTTFAIVVLLLLIFSKYIYMSCLTSYYTFYLIEKFSVSVSNSQILLFAFLAATACGTLVGGPIGDKIGRKYLIWISILGAAPFSIATPYAGLTGTVVLTVCVGLVLSSAFPAILLYAQELLPTKLGMVSGLFFGFMFGVAGIASAVLGSLADTYGIDAVFYYSSFTPLLGVIAIFLPNLHNKRPMA